MLSPRKIFDRLNKKIDNLQSLKETISRITTYKNRLEEIPKNKLNDNQKIWLLAHEASEKRLQTSSKDQIAEDMFLLLKFIPDEK